jgi:hypothetical protein
MNDVTFFILEKFAFKTLLRKDFSFLETDFGFCETKDEKLIIPDWLIRGICYTNNKVLIQVGDDIKENRFSILIYKIQADFKMPIYNKFEYFTLADFLKIKNINNADLLECYDNINELKVCVENSAKYLKTYLPEVFTFLEGEHTR